MPNTGKRTAYKKMCYSAQLHVNICKESGVQLDKKHWYRHVPKSVEAIRGGKVTILWNQRVQTDKTIPYNKPDIVIHNNEKGMCMLTDVVISGDRNVIQKENSFGGLMDSMRASGTQDCGFEPGQIHWIFRAKKSTACLPSEGK
jgi:hypothetical protein